MEHKYTKNFYRILRFLQILKFLAFFFFFHGALGMKCIYLQDDLLKKKTIIFGCSTIPSAILHSFLSQHSAPLK